MTSKQSVERVAHPGGVSPVACFFGDGVVEDPHFHHPDPEHRPDWTVPVHPRCHQEHHDIAPRDLGAYRTVGVFAVEVDEVEALRIAAENRLRACEQYGLDEERFERMRAWVDDVRALERGAVRELEAAVRETPLASFISETPGLGMKSVGRLLSAIGDPAWHPRDQRPRKLYELFAYCGMHTVPAAGLRIDDTLLTSTGRVAPRRRKGQQANWNGDARKHLYVIATGMLKNRRSAYRPVYDAAREKYEARSDNERWRVHARAMRIVMKAILKDLWRAASREANPTSRSPSSANSEPSVLGLPIPDAVSLEAPA